MFVVLKLKKAGALGSLTQLLAKTILFCMKNYLGVTCQSDELSVCPRIEILRQIISGPLFGVIPRPSELPIA